LNDDEPLGHRYLRKRAGGEGKIEGRILDGLYKMKYSAHINIFHYMASITFGEMADCDWLRSSFSGALFSRNGSAVDYVKTNGCILKQNSKTN
jgi:hypothetical protein